MSYWRTIAGFPRDVRLYIAISAAVGFSYFGVTATLLNLYVLRLGFEPRFVGVMTGSGQLAGILCSLPLAALARRIGPRNGIVGSLSLASSAIALTLFAEIVPPDLRAGWLIACSIGLWIGAVLFGSSAQPYLMGTARAPERTHAFAVRQMALALMTVAGSLVGGLLPGLYAARRGMTLEAVAPYRAVLWLAVAGLALGAILGMAARPIAITEDAADAGGERPPLAFLLGFGLVVFLGAACVGARLFFFNIYLDAGLHVPVGRIGLAMALGGLLGAFAPLTAPPLVSRIGTARVVALASTVMALSTAMIGASSAWALVVTAYIGAVGAAALIEPTRMLFGLEQTAAAWRTAVAAVATVGGLVGWAFASFTGSQLIVSRGYTGLFNLAAVLGAASGLAILVLARSSSARKAIEADA